MKIKIKTSCSGLDFAYTAGETVDAPEKRAADLINARYAEEAKQTVEGKPNEEAKETAGEIAKPAGAKRVPKD